MVEQRTLNPLVQGSSPCWGTMTPPYDITAIKSNYGAFI